MILPQTEWVQPTEYPDLRSYDEIAIDLETRDPDLKSKGSGAVIGNGEVVGIAVATSSNRAIDASPVAAKNEPGNDLSVSAERAFPIFEVRLAHHLYNKPYSAVITID